LPIGSTSFRPIRFHKLGPPERATRLVRTVELGWDRGRDRGAGGDSRGPDGVASVSRKLTALRLHHMGFPRWSRIVGAIAVVVIVLAILAFAALG
jgi:hypothetical protein